MWSKNPLRKKASEHLKFDEIIICQRPETNIWGYLSSALLKSLDRFIVFSNPNWIDRWQAVSLTLSQLQLYTFNPETKSSGRDDQDRAHFLNLTWIYSTRLFIYSSKYFYKKIFVKNIKAPTYFNNFGCYVGV